MIRRLFSWLARRQADAHRANDIIRESREAIERVEAMVERQEQGPERVNLIRDRITGTWGRA